MRARQARRSETLSSAVTMALATPARALESERSSLENRLGADLGQLRVHRGPEVDRAAETLGALGFALGRHVALPSHAEPGTLAHEAAHAVQQDMAEPGTGAFDVAPAHDLAERAADRAARGGGEVGRKVGGGQPVRLMRDLTDPGRLAEVHQAVRVTGPPRPATGGGTTNRQPWVDPSGTNGGTAAVLEQEVRDFFRGAQLRPITAQTTQPELEQDAEAINQRVIDRFPQIPSPLSATEVRNRTQFSTPAAIRQDQDFLNQWFDNVLHQFSSAEDFAIDTSNASYQAMRTRLFNDTDVGPLLVGLAARQSAFTTGEGPDRRVFMHEKVADAERPLTLIHEYVHLYRHTRFRDWAQASRDSGVYNEGMTEWLARKVMTSSELTGRTRYQDRVDAVDQQIAPHVPEDDVARAVFRGEIWRLETRSAEARGAFEAETGISESASEADQRRASRSAPGLFQTVDGGRHYRFLNLGFDEAQPKPEHVAALRTVKTEHYDADPQVRMRFVGHASGPGSEDVNRRLSLRRARAFYRLAENLGVAASRLLDRARPPHFGETRPTATEEDAITRAMNRRVELFLVKGGTR